MLDRSKTWSVASGSSRHGGIETMSYILTGIGLIAAFIYLLLEYRKASDDNGTD